MRPMAAPVSRLILHGERPCQICGAGLQAHADAGMGHPFPPPPWEDVGFPRAIQIDELTRRGFWGRLKWALLDR